MIRPHQLLLAAVAAVSLVASGVAGIAAGRSQQHLELVIAEATQTQRSVRALADAKGASSALARRSRPGVGLAANLASVLQAVGLPPATLASATAQPETSVSTTPDVRVLQQNASVILAGITLPQLGAFLQAWRTAQPLWIVAAIDVSAEPGGTASPGDDRQLRVSLTLQAMYLDDAQGGTP